MIKSLISATGLSFALATSAFAADLPSRKAPVYIPPPAPAVWTGFYVGLNAGGGWGTSTSAYTTSAPLLDQWAAANSYTGWTTPGIVGVTALANSGFANVNQGGFIGGGQVGYNYQFAGPFVAGLEADIQGSTIGGSGQYSGVSSDSAACCKGEVGTRTGIGFGRVSAGIDWLGTVRARIGYLFTPTLLVYGTGGLAYGGIHLSSSNAFFGHTHDTQASPVDFTVAATPSTGSVSDTLVGYSVGGGAEWMFLPNWSVKAEALYYSLGGANLISSPLFTSYNWNVVYCCGWATGFPFTANIPSTHVSFNGVIARVGVNYHFNWFAPAPVLAKY